MTVGKRELHADESLLAPIRYRVSFREAASHQIEVEVQIPTDGLAELRLMMPVWTPGSYLIREYPRQVERIVARDGLTDELLSIHKVSKNQWSVGCAGRSEIVVRYSLYCREMSVRTNWVERDFAFITGAATFLTRADALQRKHIVRLEPVPVWPDVATSLGAQATDDRWTRVATNYDELVDSPIVLGTIDIRTFESGGATHHLATVGGEPYWDSTMAANDAAKIIAAEQTFWGVVPYRDYWILNLATETGGGLEHDNSTVLMTSRWAQRSRSKYMDWLGLVSHEFFHTWNVRRLRPKVLKSYDYNSEQYTHELWIAEGITSYYDDLFLSRSGICTPKEYLERLSKNIATVQNGPGRMVQPLTESSFDTWIKFYRPDENAGNSRVSYYLKGALMGLLLDVEIRSHTNNQKSLDDVMRLLWTRHLESGYDNADFAKIVDEVAGQPISVWLEEQLTTTREADYTQLLAWYGLQWKAKDGEAVSTPASDKSVYGNVYVGLDVLAQGGKAMVDKVTRGSPASAAGINSGDEILALDGYRVLPENWTERLALYRPDDSLSILIARRGKVVELKLKLGKQPAETWSLIRVEKPTDEQTEHWNSWLGIVPSSAN